MSFYLLVSRESALNFLFSWTLHPRKAIVRLTFWSLNDRLHHHHHYPNQTRRRSAVAVLRASSPCESMRRLPRLQPRTRIAIGNPATVVNDTGSPRVQPPLHPHLRSLLYYTSELSGLLNNTGWSNPRTYLFTLGGTIPTPRIRTKRMSC